MIVTGDHGFVTVEYNLNLWPIFEPLGDKVRLHPQGLALFVEKTDQFSPAEDKALLMNVLEEAKNVEGVQKVLSSDQFVELGLPRYEDNPLIQGQYLVLGTPDNHLRSNPDQTSKATLH